MDEMTQLLRSGMIGPIEHQATYDISQLESALNTFSKGLHTGKFVITFSDPETRLKVSNHSPHYTFPLTTRHH